MSTLPKRLCDIISMCVPARAVGFFHAKKQHGRELLEKLCQIRITAACTSMPPDEQVDPCYYSSRHPVHQSALTEPHSQHARDGVPEHYSGYRCPTPHSPQCSTPRRARHQLRPSRILVPTMPSLTAESNQQSDIGQINSLMNSIGAALENISPVTDLGHLFGQFDLERSGSLDEYQLAAALAELGLDVARSAMDMLLTLFDTDDEGSRACDYKAFCKAFYHRHSRRRTTALGHSTQARQVPSIPCCKTDLIGG